jgi:amino acid transporter
MSKEQYNVNESPDSPDYNGHANAQYVDPATGIESKQGRITEAADVYGNIETAEEYGYVTRGFVHFPLKMVR